MSPARVRCVLSSFLLVVAVAGIAPTRTAGQEVSIGVLWEPEPSVGDTQVGPAVSAAVSRSVLGVPLFFEGSIARTDFRSLGQDYHNDHYLLALGAEWFPADGRTRLGLRLALAAYGEYQTIEGNPSVSGGDNWAEAVVPGLVLERELSGGKRVVAGLSDVVVGPWFAILDSSEYGVEHRLRLLVGVRF